MKTKTANVCGKCGTKIFADAPQGFCSICMLRTGLGPLTDDEIDDTLDMSAARMLMDFGEYELQGEIGRGGQGVVYRARQKTLNRTVAIKVIALGPWATEAHLKRFRLEAEAAASLDHPRIVPIYEIGQRDGCCYFSMKFVEGGQLDESIRHKSMPPRQAVELVAKLARTVHYAHQRGILHLDIKPGNILVDGNGEPHLTDFGLARLVEKESTIARTIEVLGTPSYMAPEQAAGQTGQFTTATDIYGLGAVAYHLLTGQPPFVGGTTYETIRQVLETEPRPPSLLNRALGRDLETICLKCLEKEPSKRFASADALANELERFLRGEPIRSRRISGTERVWRWCKRKPVIAGLTSALIATVIGGSIAVVWQLQRAREEEAVAWRNLYSADMNLAHQAWQEGNLQRAQSLLRAHLPVTGREDSRGFEWRYLWQLCRDESRFTFAPAHFTPRQSDGGPSHHLVLAQDGHTIITASGNRLRWIDVQSQREVQTLNTGSDPVRALATATKRPGLLAYYADKIRCISPSGEALLGGGVSHESCNIIALSPDGTLLAAGGLNRFSRVPVRLWEVGSGRLLGEYLPNGIGATSLAFSSDGKYLLCGVDAIDIDVFETSTLHLLQRIEAHSGWVNALAFNRAGTQLASGSNDGQIIVWSFPEMREITRLLGHHGIVNDLTFGPDDQLLVSGGGDQTLRVWDLNRPGAHTILRGHRAGVKSVFFSDDGKELYSGSYDDTVKVWPVEFGESHDVLRQERFLFGVAFSPDGKLLAAADYDAHAAALWDVASRRRLDQSIGQHSEAVQRVAFSPDGKLLATAGTDNEVRLWNLAESRTAFVFPKTHHMFGMAFHPVEPVLAIAADNLRFWNAQTGRETKPLADSPEHGVARVAFSPDGKWSSLGLEEGSVALQSLSPGERAHFFHEHSSHVTQICFSRDSALLASADRNSRIVLYDVGQQRVLKSFEAHTDAVWGLAFTPDGKTLVSTSSDGTIKFWRLPDQQLALTLSHDTGPVLDVAFSPNGDLMATCGLDRTLRFWPAPSLAEIDAAEKRAASQK